MNARQQAILVYLGHRQVEFSRRVGFTARELALAVGAPAPSVRRAVASLRQQGFNIVSRRGNVGPEYVLLNDVVPVEPAIDDPWGDRDNHDKYDDDIFDQEDRNF